MKKNIAHPMMTENYCDECDAVIHAVVDAEEFYDHKVGRVRCPECGFITKPCNECETHDACGDCPYKKSKIVNAMTDKEYVKWEKEHSPELYKLFLSGKCGDFYAKIANEIELEGKCGDDKIVKLVKKMEKMGLYLYDVTDDAVIFKDVLESINICDKLLKFKSWKDVKRYCTR